MNACNGSQRLYAPGEQTMIGIIVSLRDTRDADGNRERFTEIHWVMHTLEGGDGSIDDQITLPPMSILPGFHGEVGDNVGVTVLVLPKEDKPK